MIMELLSWWCGESNSLLLCDNLELQYKIWNDICEFSIRRRRWKVEGLRWNVEGLRWEGDAILTKAGMNCRRDDQLLG